MQINPYSIPPAASAIFILGFGLFTLHKNFSSPKNHAFFLLCLFTTIWLLTYAISFSLSEKGLISLLQRIGFSSVAIIPGALFQLITALFNIHSYKKWTKIIYCIGACFIYLILTTNIIIGDPIPYFWGMYPKAGIAHPFFLIYFLSVVFITYLPLVQITIFNQGNLEKTRHAKYILLALLFFSTACLDYLPNYGKEIYPAGYLFAVLFLIVVGYATIRHHLLDVNIIIKKGIIYSCLLTLISLTYVIMVLSFERIFQGFFQYNNLPYSIFIATLVALMFIPLRNQIQEFLDRHFLKGTPIEIAEENEHLWREVANSEKLHAIATLASGLAHEIKNPLTSIKTFTEYLDPKKNDPEFLKKFSRIVGHEVDRIDNLVHQLLEFAKPTPPLLKITDVHLIISDTLTLLNNEFLKHQINISLNLNAASMPLADANQLKQALLNIFLNALDAMKNGGTLAIETSNPTAGLFRCAISDTGIGIDKNDLPHIFDPFFTKKDRGTGLGLAITYGIIKEHGGSIRVESALGKGTKFIIELPVQGTTNEIKS
ncbi:MAG: ATP-binding protein [Candidatus Omnitrophota bacterium]|nr:ATP-binding protein [Candidatus Omnitrophota bacterium]